MKNKPAFIFVLLVLFAFIPTSYFENGNSLCLIRNVFGVECFGCGMTRAMSCMFHGNIVAAIEYNKMIVIVFPLLIYMIFINA